MARDEYLQLCLRDLDEVAEGGLRLADGSGGEFEDFGGSELDSGDSPGDEIFFEVNDEAVGIEIEGVDGKAHGEGMNAAGGRKQKPPTGREAGGAGGHESAKARPMSRGHSDIVGEAVVTRAIVGLERAH